MKATWSWMVETGLPKSELFPEFAHLQHELVIQKDCKALLRISDAFAGFEKEFKTLFLIFYSLKLSLERVFSSKKAKDIFIFWRV